MTIKEEALNNLKDKSLLEYKNAKGKDKQNITKMFKNQVSMILRNYRYRIEEIDTKTSKIVEIAYLQNEDDELKIMNVIFD